MKYIIFSKLNRNYFLFLSYFIISIIKDIVNQYIHSSGDIVETFNKYYINTLSDLLSIIPIIIIKIRSKSASNKNQDDYKDNKKENILRYFYKNMNKKREKRIVKLSILVSILDFLALYINVTFTIIVTATNFTFKKYFITSDILFNVISKFAFGALILHLPIYRHHYLSLFINLIFLILLIIYDVINMPEARSYLYALKRLISVFLYSLEDVYAKILLSFNSISPYSYLLYRGIFLNILSLLYSIAFIFVELPDEKGIKSIIFTRFWKVYENRLNILLYIILLFVVYLYNQNVLLIIDKFSPLHYAVGTVLENLGTLLIAFIYKDKISTTEFVIRLIIYFILILAALVFNEFIVLNFCGFQKYTHLFLRKEADNEACNNLELTIFEDNDNEILPEDENDKKEKIHSDNLLSEIDDMFNLSQSRNSSFILFRDSLLSEFDDTKN